VIFPTLFSNRNSLLLLALADAIPYEKLLKLDKSQKAYSVNKGLFLGVFSLPCFAYMGRYRDAIYRALVNYAEIFYDSRY